MAKTGPFLARLSQREKRFLFVGSTLIALILFYLYLIDPIRQRTVQLDQLIPKQAVALKTLSGLSEEYRFLSTQIKAIEGRLPEKNQFSPLSYLEDIASRNDVRDRISYIRSMVPVPQAGYQEIPMEVKMEDISLSRIVPYLSTLENAPYFLRIKRLNIKTRYADPEKLDVIFVVSSYEKLNP
jgi:hypothetical protein